MASFAEETTTQMITPAGDFAPLIRTGNMIGPEETNWILSGQLLCGPHPGLVSKTNLIRNLESIIKEDVNLFVCLQEEMSSEGDAHINSARSAGSNLIRPRNAYGLRYMSSCGPYLADAKLVANRLHKSANAIHFMHFPIPEANDAVTSDSEVTKITQRILAAIMAGDRIYLHCSNGNGRSGTIGALLLGIIHGLSSSEALTLVDMYRTHRRGIQGIAVETHQQKAQVHRLLSNVEWRTMICTTKPRSASSSQSRQVGVDKVLEEIKGGLMRRGKEAFIKLRRLFERRDYENTGRINLYDLTESLRNLGLGVRDSDVVSIIKKFGDTDSSSSNQNQNQRRRQGQGQDQRNVGHHASGTINYRELLNEIRGTLSNERLKVVRQAYDKIRQGNLHQTAMMNFNNNNYNSYDQPDRALQDLPDHLTLLQMKKHYQAKNVHDVKNGKMSVGEATSNFLDTFFNAGVTDRQIVTYDDFVEYYTSISASFDANQDRAFQLLLWDCWGLSDSDSGRLSQRGPAGGAPNQRDPYKLRPGGPRHSVEGVPRDSSVSDKIHQYQQSQRSNTQPQPSAQQAPRLSRNDPATIMESIRDELLTKKRIGGGDSLTTGGINVEGLVNFVASLRAAASGSINGTGGSHGYINRLSFHRVVEQCGGNSGALTRASIDSLYDAFVSTSNQGQTVNTSDVMNALCGDLPTVRMEMVSLAFQSLDASGTGRVHIRDVAKKYLAKKHPEVISGRHTGDENFFSFFDGFRKLCASTDGYVTLDMFIDYYRVVSASFPDDNYFRILMWSVWELAGNSRLTNHKHHRSILERATAGAGRHKPGPAHRARSFPVVERTFHQQKMVDSASSHHPSNWGGDIGGVASDKGSNYGGIGIVPNANSSQSWANSPHMHHHPKSGTMDAARRTYASSVGKIIGTGSGTGNNYWNNKSKNQNERRLFTANDPMGPVQLTAQMKSVVKNGLVTRGVHGFISLLRAFEQSDRGDRGGYDGNLPLSEFFAVLRNSGFNITLEQCSALFSTLGLSSGTDEADEIDYGGFIESLCGDITQTRLAMIHQAFSKFDHNNNGFVPLEDLHSGFNASKHPEVTNGTRLASQVHREFIDNFTVADAHGKVSIEAFELYFKFISACVMEDSDFQVSNFSST
jgi:Ca2+-binding EF-hand superfamily protein/protein-tyrosine phosphatase